MSLFFNKILTVICYAFFYSLTFSLFLHCNRKPPTKGVRVEIIEKCKPQELFGSYEKFCRLQIPVQSLRSSQRNLQNGFNWKPLQKIANLVCVGLSFLCCAFISDILQVKPLLDTSLGFRQLCNLFIFSNSFRETTSKNSETF